MLKIQIISASNVPNVDTLGKSDPYVRCRFRGIKQKTSVKKDTLDPEWNETLEWDLAGTPITRSDKLEVLVKDSDFTRDKLLGKVEIPLRNVTSGAAGKEMELPLMDKDQRPTSGRLRLKLDYSPPSMPSAAAGNAGTATVNSAGDTSVPAAATTGSAMHAPVAGGMLSAHSSRSAATSLPANSGTRARDQMPDKETKFQVRVKVVEARQLIGDDVNPTCRVLVGGQGKSTHVQKSSHSPWFNEVFFFYIEKKPSQVWDTPVELRICNSKMMRSKVVLGTFRLDLGTIYDQPQHAFINKWLPLASQDEQDTDLKGYLKVSMVVLGPHDECPELKASQDADDDDVEQNLLFSSQIHLTPASINMNIYQAEDLPRMDAGVVSRMKQFFRIGDSSNKQSVDPFVELCFAGKQVQTPVEMENCNPTFMQQLHIGVHLPSFAKNMKLILHDWDRGSSSDTIACANIALRHISTSGEGGFLPTFGPSFVCFYGGTREFSVLDKEGEYGLNEGKLEGCAFRGRVLLSLNTTVGELPIIDSEPISFEDTLKIDAFLKRKSYLLHCAFEDAGMISEVNTPVEFELSMGNYGNKFESSQMPSPSFTQPTNAVYDGCSYYFLPWEDSKPCVTVPCQWEDISHRLYAINSLMQTVSELERGVENLKTRRQAGETPEKLSSCLADVCGQLLQNCRVPLPSPGPVGGGSNPLDHLLAAKRRGHIDAIVKSLLAMKQTMPSLEEAIGCLEGFHASLSELAEEPQQSMPDVIIWMLAGKERLAYARIPAHTILFAEDTRQRGANCGRIQSILLKFPGHKNKLGKIPGLLRVRLWLGKQGENKDWLSHNKEAETVVFAETYENQTSIAGHWVTKGPLMSRPKWSDADGDIKLPQESFEAPDGWTFDGDWFVDPEPSLFYEADAGHSTFLEDVFENEFRLPGGDWKPDLTHWSDVRKDPATPRDEREPPAGWKWDDAWQVDTRRAVDGDGWEYCVESSMGGYGPAQKLYHLCRRRRWVRPRRLLNQVVLEKSEGDEEGWAYAAFFGRKFHARHRKVDMVRRRRWHRKLMMSSQVDAGLPIFKMSDSDSNVLLNSPMLYLKYSEGYKFQLRAHIYQARQLHSGDKSGLSDPYVCLSYLKKSYRTDHMSATVCPTWNQTIVLDEITIHGSLHEIEEQPPSVVIEIYDHDTYGEPEFLGRVTASPTVHLKSGHSPPLQWYPMSRGDQQQGELLASFELYCKLDDELPLLPPQNDNGTYCMPSEIRPVLQRTAVEILCWGVRNMKRYKLAMVQKPTVEFECAGNMVCSEIIKNVKQHPNFDDPFLFMEVMLPSEPLYMPPLNIQIRDHRMFGDNPVVGSHVIKSLNQYRIEPLTSVKSTPLRRLTSSRSQSSVNQDTSTTVIDIETVPSEASTFDDKLVDLADTSENTDSKRSRRGMGRTAGKFGYEPLTEVDSPQQSLKDDETLPAQSHPPTPSRSVSIRGNFSGNRDFKHRRLSQQKTDTLIGKESKSIEKLDIHDAKMGSSDKEQDWWSKYYASIGEVDKSGDYLANGYETLEVYPVELESVPAFGSFRDILNNFEMIRGKSTGDDESAIVGEFKGTVRVYALPDDRSLPLPPKQIRGIPSSMSEDLIVRVYVVRCWDLCPQDPSGMSDPFIMVKIGDEQKSTRKDYKPNTLNPIFGSFMEFTCTLPKEKELVVSLMDYDLMSKDDLIGETRIDLENRFMTKFRATCGLQSQYHLFGPNQWRDAQTPREILNIVCDMNNRPQPLWLSSTEVVIGEQRYCLKDLEDSSRKRPQSLGAEDERLALLVLQTFDLVPEHVETRRLFNPSMPDIEQGKVEMFVDVFPASMGTPGPMVDITPRCPTKYVLRVVVYNVYDVLLQEYSAISGSNMSDVYVKCWLQGDKDVQKTDVHYRCMDGEAMFNWRFVFDIEYLEAEKMMVIKSKDHFWSLDEREQRRPPKLMLQLWDNDLISKDDYLGELELDLSRMMCPARVLEKCGLHQLSVGDHCPSNGTDGTTTCVATSADRPEADHLSLNLRNRNKACATHMDIWQRGRVRGFWPAVGTQDNNRICAGKIEMEIEVVTALEAEARPAAKAREEPNMNPTLQLPQRPATSFMWFSSPWKSFRYIIWRRYKWYVITVLVVLLLVLFVMLALYSLPGAAVDKLFGL